jgi:hypothetical protein
VLVVTEHALDRFGLHNPGANARDVEQAVLQGEPISTDMAKTLLGRRRISNDSYLLSPDRRGLFVLAQRQQLKVITYIRFGLLQEQFVLKHWPVPKRKHHKEHTPQAQPMTKEQLQQIHPVLKVRLSTIMPKKRLLRVYGSRAAAQTALMQAEVDQPDPRFDYCFRHGKVKIAAYRLTKKQWHIGLPEDFASPKYRRN